MITVRRATLDDFDRMVVTYTAGWRVGFRHMFSPTVFLADDFDTQRRGECAEATLHEGVDTYVAENEQRVVGFLAAARTCGAVRLDDVWVHPDAWGCGAAAALVTRVEDHLRTVGGRRLSTWVPEDSPRGRHFFEKIGWRPSGQIEMLAVYPDDQNRMFEYQRTLV